MLCHRTKLPWPTKRMLSGIVLYCELVVLLKNPVNCSEFVHLSAIFMLYNEAICFTVWHVRFVLVLRLFGSQFLESRSYFYGVIIQVVRVAFCSGKCNSDYVTNTNVLSVSAFDNLLLILSCAINSKDNSYNKIEYCTSSQGEITRVYICLYKAGKEVWNIEDA